MDLGPFTPDPLGSTYPTPFPWFSFGFTGPVTGFSLKRLGPPAVEPVDLTKAKLNARVYHGDEDALFALWIPAARRLLEQATGSVFISQQWEMKLPGWPADGQIRIGLGPVQSVDLLQYYAPAASPSGGTLTTLTEGVDFQTWVDYRPPFVVPFAGKFWPTVQYGTVPAVVLRFTAGYGANVSDLPEFVAPAVLMMLTYWANNRGDEEAPEKLGMPPGVLRIVQALDLTGYR